MVLGSSPVAVTSPSDFMPASSKEFLDIQATIECGFTLKHVRDMTKTYSHFSDYLSNESDSTILQLTDKKEIANKICSLNSSLKASGPNSLTYRISLLLKNEILNELANVFNLSFMAVFFPSVIKTAKVVPVFKGTLIQI